MDRTPHVHHASTGNATQLSCTAREGVVEQCTSVRETGHKGHSEGLQEDLHVLIKGSGN